MTNYYDFHFNSTDLQLGQIMEMIQTLKAQKQNKGTEFSIVVEGPKEERGTFASRKFCKDLHGSLLFASLKNLCTKCKEPFWIRQYQFDTFISSCEIFPNDEALLAHLHNFLVNFEEAVYPDIRVDLTRDLLQFFMFPVIEDQGLRKNVRLEALRVFPKWEQLTLARFFRMTDEVFETVLNDLAWLKENIKDSSTRYDLEAYERRILTSQLIASILHSEMRTYLEENEYDVDVLFFDLLVRMQDKKIENWIQACKTNHEGHCVLLSLSFAKAFYSLKMIGQALTGPTGAPDNTYHFGPMDVAMLKHFLDPKSPSNIIVFAGGRHFTRLEEWLKREGYEKVFESPLRIGDETYLSIDEIPLHADLGKLMPVNASDFKIPILSSDELINLSTNGAKY